MFLIHKHHVRFVCHEELPSQPITRKNLKTRSLNLFRVHSSPTPEWGSCCSDSHMTGCDVINSKQVRAGGATPGGESGCSSRAPGTHPPGQRWPSWAPPPGWTPRCNTERVMMSQRPRPHTRSHMKFVRVTLGPDVIILGLYPVCSK